MKQTCDECGGAGLLDPLDGDGGERECPTCEGLGYVYDRAAIERAEAVEAAATALLGALADLDRAQSAAWDRRADLRRVLVGEEAR